MARNPRHSSAWTENIDEDILEVSEIRSFSDDSSLLESPNSKQKLHLKKLKQNRVGSPRFSNASVSESSLSSETRHAFLIKQYKTDKSDLPSTETSIDENVKPTSSLSGYEGHSKQSEKSLYRERIRNRFLSIKKNATSSLKGSVKKEKRKKVLKSNEIELANADSLLNDELSNFQKSHTSVAVSKSICDSDFFCKTDFVDTERDDAVDKDNADIVVESPEAKKQTVIDLLNLIEIEDTIQFVKSSILSFNTFNNEFEKTVEQDDKPVENVKAENVRHPEDEGLYVGDQPKIGKRSLDSLYSRLSQSANGKWFNSDGQLKLLADPRRSTLLKPTLNKSDISTTFHRPMKIDSTLYQSLYSENKKNTLKIHLSKMKFTHHPLFSPEHYLAFKLEHLYDEYKRGEIDGKHVKLQNKLAVLRQAKVKIETAMLTNTENVTDKQRSRLQQYGAEIRKTRQLRLEKFQQQRELLKSILATWKNLKIIREKQKYICTPTTVTIKKEKLRYDSEKSEWDDQIEVEAKEIYEEKELEFVKMMENYKSELKRWKTERNTDVEKPVRPIKDFSLESIKENVTNSFFKCFKPPGEPKLYLELSHDKEITTDISFPREKARRNAVSKTKIHVKVFFDDKEMYKSDLIELNDSFVCNINRLISIECYTLPLKITIKIEEHYRGSNNRWHYKDVHLKAPNLDVAFENPEKRHCQFALNERITYSHTGIGMGHNFQNIFDQYSLQNIEDTEDVFLSGFLTLYLGWDVGADVGYLGASRKSAIESSQIDPQNPMNSEFINYLEQSKEDVNEANDYFRLNVGEDLFCTKEDIDNNPRYRMLILRSRGEPEFQGMQIANRESEIDIDLFAAYEARKAQDLDDYFDEDTSDYQIEIQRQWGLKQIKQIRKRVNEMCQTADNSYTLKDILVDDEVPDINLLGLTFMKWFQPKRPLRPIRKSIQQTGSLLTSNCPTDMKVVINIVQAFHVPVRRMVLQEISMSPSKRSVSDILNLIPVRPLVAVTFGSMTVSTTTAEGSNPTWNQELTLYSSRKPNEQFPEYLYVNLFDEQLVDILEDDRLRESDIHQRRQLQWLAELQIPIDIVSENNRIEGTFEMNSPPLIIGYEKHNTFNKDDSTDSTPRLSAEHRDSTFLSLFVTVISPSVNGNSVLKDDRLQCNEIPMLEKHIRLWHKEYNDMFPQRNFPVLVKDTNCKTCCVTRFLKQLNPPEFTVNDETSTQYACARFVALIPFLNDSSNYRGVWLASDQLLRLQIGSIIDHAVLLQCYFMSLSLKSWLAFGYCLHYGTTAFIFLQEASNENKKNIYSTFDVVTGHKYDVQDSFNPFKRIFCLINQENVWANIHKEDRLHLLNYNLSKNSDWLPLFSKDISVPTASFQPSQLEYSPEMNIKLLEERIETKIKLKIMKWRRHCRTVWNRHASAVFKKLLPLFEQYKMSGDFGVFDIANDQNLMLDVQNIINANKVYGFPLNLAYTNIGVVKEAIRRTNIQNNDAPNIEFGLSVYLHQYTGGIVSIWLFVCTLIRRR